MAWATPKGFNCRADLDTETDGANQVCLTDGALNIKLYPTVDTIGGDSVTFGWDAETDLETRDRNVGNDVRLEGVHFNGHATNARYCRVDLPAAGQYKLRLAMGDATNATVNQTVVIKDGVGGSTLATITDASIASNSFVDATGVERTAAAWPGSNAQLPLTFAGTVFALYLNGNADANRIAHFELEQVTTAIPTILSAHLSAPMGGGYVNG